MELGAWWQAAQIYIHRARAGVWKRLLDLVQKQGVSLTLAVSSLAILVVIHKLEYFVNARVMGGQIHTRAWEVLTAMLVMEAVFGIPGLVAAPIFYSYLKAELSLQRLV